MENNTKKDENFADFIDGIEHVVTLAPTDSSLSSETQPQPEKKLNSENVTLPEQSMVDDAVAKKPEQEFNVRKLFFLCAGLFGVSSLGVLLGHLVPIFAITIYLWYVAAGISLISVAVLFLAGIVKGFTGKSFELVGKAIVFLIVLVVVGFGTCLLNMSGM